MALCMGMALAASHAQAEQGGVREIQVLADPTLALPLTRIAREYSRNRNVTVSLSFATSDEQMKRIEQGEEADVFISTRSDVITQMKNQGLVDMYSRAQIAKNRLSMVTYGENEFQMILIPKLPLAEILDRIDERFTFAMPDPEASDFALPSMEALMNHQFASSLEPHFRFFRSASEMADTIRAKGGYGILPLSEAQRIEGVKVLGTFPETAHQPLIYEALVLAGENMKPSRAFMRHLTTKPAMQQFERFGFQPLKVDSSDSGHLARGWVSKPSRSPI